MAFVKKPGRSYARADVARRLRQRMADLRVEQSLKEIRTNLGRGAETFRDWELGLSREDTDDILEGLDR